jgi:hypothetical protein
LLREGNILVLPRPHELTTPTHDRNHELIVDTLRLRPGLMTRSINKEPQHNGPDVVA